MHKDLLQNKNSRNILESFHGNNENTTIPLLKKRQRFIIHGCELITGCTSVVIFLCSSSILLCTSSRCIPEFSSSCNFSFISFSYLELSLDSSFLSYFSLPILTAASLPELAKNHSLVSLLAADYTDLSLR